MNKFNRRINKLTVKTHGYISHYDYCLVRDYFKARFDEIDKPEDFDDQFREFSELNKQFDATNDAEIEAQLWEKMKTNSAILYKNMYQDAALMCEKYPNGIWQPKSFTDDFLKTINNARRYFKSKKSEG